MKQLQHSKSYNKLNKLGLIILLLIIILTLAHQSALSADDHKNLKFSPLEIKLHEILIKSSSSPPEDILEELNEVKNKPENVGRAQQTLITLYQCLVTAEQLPNESNSFMNELVEQYQKSPSALNLTAKYKCQQITAYEKQQGALNLEYGLYALEAAKETDYAFLLYWIALEHAYNLMEAGFLEQALMTIQYSLDLAESNQKNLGKWQKDSLSTLSLIQSDLQLYDDALNSNKRALDFATSSQAKIAILLNRAYILINANRLEEARASLNTLLSEYEDELYKDDKITILTNLSNILYRQNKNTEFLKATQSMMKQIDDTTSQSVAAYARLFHAYALLRLGQIENSKDFFKNGIKWFRDNSQYAHLAGHLKSYSEELSNQGLYLEAYNMLAEYTKLSQDLQRETDKTNALFLNAMINKEQNVQTINYLKQQQKIDQTSLRNKELLNIIWLTLLSFSIVLGIVFIYFYSKQRRMNSLLIEKNKQLNYQSIHDPLTKTNNRHFLNKFIEKKRALNIQSKVLLILLDLDRFKRINDEFGHNAGDKVLKEISARLSKTLRSSDCIIRWGGEEFLLYIETGDTQESTPLIVQRLLNIVSKESVQLEEELVNISASLGFVEFDTIPDDMKVCIKQADQYLYESKSSGRNRATGMSFSKENLLYYIKPNSVSKLKVD